MITRRDQSPQIGSDLRHWANNLSPAKLTANYHFNWTHQFGCQVKHTSSGVSSTEINKNTADGVAIQAEGKRTADSR